MHIDDTSRPCDKKDNRLDGRPEHKIRDGKLQGGIDCQDFEHVKGV